MSTVCGLLAYQAWLGRLGWSGRTVPAGLVVKAACSFEITGLLIFVLSAEAATPRLEEARPTITSWPAASTTRRSGMPSPSLRQTSLTSSTERSQLRDNHRGEQLARLHTFPVRHDCEGAVGECREKRVSQMRGDATVPYRAMSDHGRGYGGVGFPGERRRGDLKALGGRDV